MQYKMEKLPAIVKNYLFVLAICEAFPIACKGFNQGSSDDLVYVNYVVDEFSYLNITSVSANLIEDENECGFACLEITSCFSYNLAASPDSNGKLLCELLPSDKYNNSDKFVSNKFFHHFSISSPCSSWPCKNNGKCVSGYEKNSYVCVCKEGFKGEICEKAPKNCAEVYQSGSRISKVYKIDPDGLGEFEVFCDQKTAGGGWTLFQKRQDGSVDFFRAWDDYKRGFGNLNGEFWLGLDKINRLSVSGSYKLRVDLEDLHGNTAFAEYSLFAVTSERTKYRLSLGSYSGTAGDSLALHRGMAFSTKDRDNDKHSGDCASYYKGAWWYNSCYSSNLNGLYLHGKSSGQGMEWEQWKDNYSVKRSEMKIRPKGF